jgi:hypothetical protein
LSGGTTIDKTIATVLLIIGGVIISMAIFNGLYPAIMKSGSAVTNATTKVSDRIESRIEIIQVGENGTSDVHIWVKNVGTADIDDISRCDIFFGPDDDFYRVAYGGPTNPYWDYQLEGGYSEWSQTVTCRITVHLASPPAADTYLAKVVIPNGIYDSTTFSVD